MPFAIRERQQDVKHRRRQRQQRVGARTSSHDNISVTDRLTAFALFVKAIVRRGYSNRRRASHLVCRSRSGKLIMDTSRSQALAPKYRGGGGPQPSALRGVAFRDHIDRLSPLRLAGAVRNYSCLVAKCLLTRSSSRYAARLSMTVTIRAVLTGHATRCAPPSSGVSTSLTIGGGDANSEPGPTAARNCVNRQAGFRDSKSSLAPAQAEKSPAAIARVAADLRPSRVDPRSWRRPRRMRVGFRRPNSSSARPRVPTEKQASFNWTVIGRQGTARRPWY
jgi:hypothetical protein